jgi:hypothetical protein
LLQAHSSWWRAHVYVVMVGEKPPRGKGGFFVEGTLYAAVTSPPDTYPRGEGGGDLRHVPTIRVGGHDQIIENEIYADLWERPALSLEVSVTESCVSSATNHA